MRKTLLLFALFLGLGFIAYNLTKKEGSKKSTLTASDRDFAIQDIGDIHQIRITQKKYPVLLFTKDPQGWLLDNRYLANENLVKNITDVLTKAKLDHIPHRRAHKNIMKEINRNGIRVEVFDKSGNVLRNFIVGGNTKDDEGTNFLMEGSDSPYVITLPAFAGTLRSRFVLNQTDSRDPYIFKDIAEEIEEITMEYPKDKSQGFTLKRSGSNYTVTPTYSGRTPIDKKVNHILARTYFDEFNKIASEAIENNNPLRDSIAALIPFSRLSLKFKNGDIKQLSLIPLDDLLDEETNTVDVGGLMKVERFYAWSNWGDSYLVQHRLIKGLMRPYSYFFE